ncbi:hypothetical protein CPU12_05255 [Malaciobacter molluscorum LMG 25693]|uniref:Flagellar hook protein n=1 Tax=Malaciobacter molluscorum LMG 25693 TaxID=870501 RepID=A0A2G1DIV1_9BACT|nr:flagellar hook-basal body complex protein [Malaciobacter molluscorum]AXX93144.1 flagellar hook protein [Malaciobacter molluscorum LMG 25693]PHO18401.1 hypothetical protein CPU12_05255 [Malaciobacter molluscorum LMG 25693]
MISGMWNGISGINSFEKALGVGSNNIANVNTIGHKSDRASFADLMYQNGYGKGTHVQSVEKDFSQGNLKLTGNSYDVAINGKGFFLVEDPKTNNIYYTRAGNFRMGADGTLQSANGMRVHGIQSQGSTVIGTDPADTKFDKNYINFLGTGTITRNNSIQTINARSTDFTKTATDSGVSGQGYKTATSKINDIQALIANYKRSLELYSSTPDAPSTESKAAVSQIEYGSFQNELKDENDVIKVTINNVTVKQKFDTDIQTTMNKFADKISEIQGISATVNNSGVVTIKSLVPGKEMKVTDAAVNNDAPSITTVTEASLGTGQGLVRSAREALKNAIEAAGGKFIEITTNLDLSNENSLTTDELQMKLDNLNLSDNASGEIEIIDGKIYAKDGDNRFIIGSISTAFFNDELGLRPEGDNLYSKTKESGDPQDASRYNTLAEKTLELSNSTLGEELTNLMVFQRGFEANSKAITTSDEFLRTAIELKK